MYGIELAACVIIPVHVRMEVLRVPYSYSDVCVCVCDGFLCGCRMELVGLEYKWEACSRDPMLPLSLSWMVSPQVCDSTINTFLRVFHLQEQSSLSPRKSLLSTRYLIIRLRKRKI